MKSIARFMDQTACSVVDAAMEFARHPATLLLSSILFLLMLYQLENHWLSLPFAVCVVASLCAVSFAVSGRVAFSIYTGWMIAGLVGAISLVKYKLKGFSLHYHDLIFTTSDTEAISFLFDGYTHYIVPVLVLAGAMLAFAVLLCRREQRTGTGAWLAVSIIALPVLLLPVTYPAEASAQRYFYYLQGRHVTAFFVSLLDLEYLFRDNALEQRLAAIGPQPAFEKGTQGCSSGQPDIILVLSESQFNPSDLGNIDGMPELSAVLEKANGPLKPLMVESYGGGTWVTTLSLLTGLSATDFGWRSPYLTVELEGRVGETIPQVLARCGYRTAVQMPMKYGFVNEGPFFASIGFETIRDRDEIGASHYHMRDSFYFEKAEDFIKQHRKEDGRPLFLLVQTMFPHSPYETRLEPDITVPGEPLAADPAMAEYLRRLVIARDDLAAFIDQRRLDAGPHGTVIADYGDHQPSATKKHLDETGNGALNDPGSMAYRTFYTMRSYGPGGEERGPTDRKQNNGSVDIPFLGSRLMSFAGIEPGALWRDIARLDRICGGRFHACPLRDEIDKNLRRRIGSGALDILPGS